MTVVEDRSVDDDNDVTTETVVTVVNIMDV